MIPLQAVTNPQQHHTSQQLVAVNAASQTGQHQQLTISGGASGPAGQTITVIPVTGAIPMKPVTQVIELQKKTLNLNLKNKIYTLI